MFEGKADPRENTYAVVSDYVPRCCGIATFAGDLSEAIASQASAEVFTVAVNDRLEGYEYGPRVRFEMRQNVQADYRLAADYINVNQPAGVCLQHEYGIYGGPYGSHILTLLKRLRRPLVVTLHTVLKEPNDAQRQILRHIGRLSDRIVVMSEMAHEFLHDIYGIEADKIVTIPHGIPDMAMVDPSYYKDQFGVEGRKVLLTFGLLSPGKGLEFSIGALPSVVRKHPEVAYIILGATHPHVKRASGEEYRSSLARLAEDLGVLDHVQFLNRFVEPAELREFLGCADLYLTPYLNEAQITSGTLAYALGAGKAVVSTPYWHAQEMLADGRGRLVPFRDSEAIAREVIALLDDEVERAAMRKRAYNYCRRMVWSSVAQQYLEVLSDARDRWAHRRRQGITVPQMERLDELPEVDLRHLHLMTDDTGIIQHAICATPDRRHGYCTDDNARALITVCMHWEQSHDETLTSLMQRYLGFLLHAMDEQDGRFRNFMSYDRQWLQETPSEDSHARALWGLGHAVASCPHDAMVTLATRLFLRGLPAVDTFVSPRAWAFATLGICAYLRRFSGDSEARRSRLMLAERLLKHFQDHMSDEWPWCEDSLTYSNAALPHALIISGRWMGRNDIIDVGSKALDWLLKVQTSENGALSLVGNSGWFTRGGSRSRYDQQAIDAHALLDACVEAYHVTLDSKYIQHARRCIKWFLGDNDIRTSLYDFTTGGCHDGLQADRVNENQGAESLLAWLMSLLLMHELQTEMSIPELPSERIPEPKATPQTINQVAG